MSALTWQEFGWVNCCINFDSLKRTVKSCQVQSWETNLSLSQGLRERRHHLGKLRVLFAFLWIKREGALLLIVLLVLAGWYLWCTFSGHIQINHWISCQRGYETVITKRSTKITKSTSMKIPKTASPSGLSAAFSGVPYWIDEEGSTLDICVKEKCWKAIWAFCLFNKPWCCSEQCAARHRTASHSQCARFRGRRTSPNGRAFATPARCYISVGCWGKSSDSREPRLWRLSFVVFVTGNLKIDLPHLGFCCWLSAFSVALFGKFYLELARNGSSSETTALSRKLDEPWCARVGHGQRRTLMMIW